MNFLIIGGVIVGVTTLGFGIAKLVQVIGVGYRKRQATREQEAGWKNAALVQQQAQEMKAQRRANKALRREKRRAKIEKAKGKVIDGAGAVKDGIGWAAGKTKDGIGWTAGKAKDGIGWTAGKVKSGAGWVAGKAKDGAGKFAEDVKKAGQDFKAWCERQAKLNGEEREAAKNYLVGTASNIRRGIKNAATTVGEKLGFTEQGTDEVNCSNPEYQKWLVDETMLQIEELNQLAIDRGLTPAEQAQLEALEANLSAFRKNVPNAVAQVEAERAEEATKAEMAMAREAETESIQTFSFESDEQTPAEQEKETRKGNIVTNAAHKVAEVIGLTGSATPVAPYSENVMNDVKSLEIATNVVNKYDEIMQNRKLTPEEKKEWKDAVKFVRQIEKNRPDVLSLANQRAINGEPQKATIQQVRPSEVAKTTVGKTKNDDGRDMNFPTGSPYGS